MKEEEVLYYQSGNTITCIIYHKNNAPLQFISKNFIGFNQTIITDKEYKNLTEMRPMDAKNYFIQLWCKYNKSYFNFTFTECHILILWKLNKINHYCSGNVIDLDTLNQTVHLHNIPFLNLKYDVEINEEDYQEIIQLTELDNSLGFIHASTVFFKYTGKSIDEINLPTV